MKNKFFSAVKYVSRILKVMLGVAFLIQQTGAFACPTITTQDLLDNTSVGVVLGGPSASSIILRTNTELLEQVFEQQLNNCHQPGVQPTTGVIFEVRGKENINADGVTYMNAEAYDWYVNFVNGGITLGLGTLKGRVERELCTDNPNLFSSGDICINDPNSPYKLDATVHSQFDLSAHNWNYSLQVNYFDVNWSDRGNWMTWVAAELGFMLDIVLLATTGVSPGFAAIGAITMEVFGRDHLRNLSAETINNGVTEANELLSETNFIHIDSPILRDRFDEETIQRLQNEPIKALVLASLLQTPDLSFFPPEFLLAWLDGSSVSLNLTPTYVELYVNSSFSFNDVSDTLIENIIDNIIDEYDLPVSDTDRYSLIDLFTGHGEAGLEEYLIKEYLDGLDYFVSEQEIDQAYFALVNGSETVYSIEQQVQMAIEQEAQLAASAEALIENVAIQANNGLFVMAQHAEHVGHEHDLKAVASAIGPWETFDILQYGDDTLSISTQYGDWVAADQHQYNLLRANRSFVGPEAIFEIVDLGKDTFALRSMNGTYISKSAAHPYGLYAAETNISSQSTFTLHGADLMGSKIYKEGTRTAIMLTLF